MKDNKLHELLRYRILHALIDDEEFLEEIYTEVNFTIEEYLYEDDGMRFYRKFNIDEYKQTGRSTLFYRAYKVHFRLTEIVEELFRLIEEMHITYRTPEGFSTMCGPIRHLYLLTATGETMWKEQVRKQVDRLFD